MNVRSMNGQFAEELAELHDGSITLFVTLPVFRSLLLSEKHAKTLAAMEGGIGEHLAYLDGIVGDILLRRERSDGYLTRELFGSIPRIRLQPASPARDGEILRTVAGAQSCLMGSCSFALRYAHQAGTDRCVQVLQHCLATIGSLADRLVLSAWERDNVTRYDHSDAVA